MFHQNETRFTFCFLRTSCQKDATRQKGWCCKNPNRTYDSPHAHQLRSQPICHNSIEYAHNLCAQLFKLPHLCIDMRLHSFSLLLLLERVLKPVPYGLVDILAIVSLIACYPLQVQWAAAEKCVFPTVCRLPYLLFSL